MKLATETLVHAYGDSVFNNMGNIHSVHQGIRVVVIVIIMVIAIITLGIPIHSTGYCST